MRIISAHVSSGTVVLDEQTQLPEGAAVMVIADAPDTDFDVSPELAAELEASLREAESGDVVSASAVLARLRG